MADQASPALNTQIESGHFDEKKAPIDPSIAKEPKPEDDEEEDEDIDALIEDLESQDGHAAGDEEEEEERDQHGGRVIPEELLQTVSVLRIIDASCYCLPSHANHPILTGHPHRSYRDGGHLPPQEVWSQPDEGGEGEPDPQVLHVLCRSYSIRHGGCCRPCCRS